MLFKKLRKKLRKRIFGRKKKFKLRKKLFKRFRVLHQREFKRIFEKNKS